MRTNVAAWRASAATLAAVATVAWGQAQAPADAPPASAAASPAVQKVSVKGIARFDFDRTGVNDDDGTKLMTEVRSLKNVTWQTIRVVGHTDNIGADAYNLKLSQRRAEAVQAFLVGRGVKPERIHTAAMGKRQPIAPNTTASGRAANRRAEIEFQGLQAIGQ